MKLVMGILTMLGIAILVFFWGMGLIFALLVAIKR